MKGSKNSDTRAILHHWREAVPDDRLAHLIKDAARALVRSLAIRLAGHKVSFGHWAFLRILWEGDGLTQRELSAEAGVMEPTTFSAIKTMERLGYVTRRQVGGDRKKMYVFLTPKGRGLKYKLVPIAEEVNRIAINGVTSEDVTATRRLLLGIIHNMAHDEEALERKLPSTRVLARMGARTNRKRRRA